jgi:hypothetical protein
MTVLEALKSSGGAVLVDDLVSRTGLTVGEVSSQLTILEINGQARELGGRWQIRQSTKVTSKKTTKPKAVKKARVAKVAKPKKPKFVGTQVVVIKFCRHAFQDPSNGQFISKADAARRGAVVPLVQFEDKPRPTRAHSDGVLKYPLKDGSYALYRVKRSKSGRDIVKVAKFIDPNADKALKATKDKDLKLSILGYKQDVRRITENQLQLEYDNDFQGRELKREMKSSIGKRSAVTRAKNKKVPSRKNPTKTEAQTAIVRLTREIQDLTVKINKPGVSKSKTQARAARQRKQSFLREWSAVAAGKKSTYPKSWRKT